MSKYKLTTAAKADLKAIWTYTEEHWGMAQADLYLDQLAQGLETLAAAPELGRARNEIRIGYRSFPLGRHIAFYRISMRQIEVVPNPSSEHGHDWSSLI